VVANIYLKEVQQNLPRLLALMDTDRTSRSYGVGDRYYWAWGLIDFGNATFQGVAHGMARLWRSGLWPYPAPKEQFFERIDALFSGAEVLTRSDGSLEEAFPNEGSYCVTALVAFDLLCALDQLDAEIDENRRRRWRKIIQPMIGYLIKADETHALISNHLATAVAALVRWHRLTADSASERKASQLLDEILKHQSDEGWFREYEGADPGYQSLCTYYLADVHQQRPDWSLLTPLKKSFEFLWHFAHPDGSFGGLYGSRNTRFYYPAGVLALAQESLHAASLANFMASSISQQRVVTLSTMDEPNLIPMFNAYCWAAQLENERVGDAEVTLLPSQTTESFRSHFPDAGIWIDAGPEHYTVINTHKGGVVAHFPKSTSAMIDAGVVIRNPKGQQGSTQAFNLQNIVKLEGDTLIIEAKFVPMPKRLTNPLQFIVLRLFCMTFFRFRILREWTKQALVYLLISPSKQWPVKNKRRINFGHRLVISDESPLPAGYVRLENPGDFVSIHMASQGYWQVQDEGDAT